MWELAEDVARDTFDAVALHGEPHVLLGDHQAEPMAITAIRGRQEQEVPVAGFCLHVVEDAPVVLRIKQASRFAEAILDAHSASCPRRSGRKNLAAPGATAIEDLAAAAGSHAGPKAVGALALDHAGLECSLHDGIPPVWK